MARPHIEFIQSQAVPWSDNLWSGRFEGTAVRILSEDGETGAASTMVRYPAGWSRSSAEHLSADEELLVLGGDLEINGVQYDELCYAHIPAGHTRRDASSRNGAVVLTFVSGRPETLAGEGPDDDAERLVEKVDVLGTKLDTSLRELGVDVDEGDGMLDGFRKFSRIICREDPHTHDQTWVLSAPPLWRNDVIEIHPVVEEMYLVTGDLTGDTGLMKPGAYFWRPPGMPHGPFGSKTGNLLFFRTQGGPLSTDFQPGEHLFSWDAKLNPVLPPEMAEYAPKVESEAAYF